MKRIISLLLTLGILSCIAATSAYAQDADTDTPIIGDLDGDKVVEIRDVTFLQRYLLRIELPFSVVEGSADADEDGEVTIIDATCIQRWLNRNDMRVNIGSEVIPWFDKTDISPVDYFDGGYFTITRVCQTHIYAYSSDYNFTFKFNGKVDKNWGPGDEVFCSFENIYYDDDAYGRAEADLVSISWYWEVPDPFVCYKPVIYLYPEQETEVDVRLELDGSLLYTKPVYEDGWKVKASPDGTLTAQNGRTYPYLFWEGKLNTEYDFSAGFCVKGSDTEAFLRGSLTTMGLNQQETDDFIGFWLQFMKDNPYNVISFQTSAYTDLAKLDITPQPDTEIRVFMAWYDSDEEVSIPAQTLTSAERNGFTAVEWGGQKCR